MVKCRLDTTATSGECELVKFISQNSPKRSDSSRPVKHHYRNEWFWIERAGIISKFHLPLVFGFITLFLGGWALERASGTPHNPRTHFPNSRIINWKSRSDVIQFLRQPKPLTRIIPQEAQRLGHFKAQLPALVRQLARRRISFSGACRVRAWNRWIECVQPVWCGLNAPLSDSAGL